MAELKYWIWINELGLRPHISHQLLDYFGSVTKIFFADQEELSKVPGLQRREIDLLSNKGLGHVRDIQEALAATKARIITLHDAEYPKRLRHIADPPLLLYMRGTLPPIDDEATIGIVGTRSCSTYGISASKKLGEEIAFHGGIVVTGMATGIDAAAARGALLGGGTVIGVLGTGVERVYPPQKESVHLFEDLLENGGCLLSEYPPGSEPHSYHFPRRNRIITGLSLALVAVEIPTERSGALISVNHALEQGRDVFIVPANIDSPASKMSNQLLAEGLPAITKAWDALSSFEGKYPRVKEHNEVPSALRTHAPKTNPLALSSKKSSQKPVSTKKVIDTIEKEDYIEFDTLLSGRSDAEIAVLHTLGNMPIHVDEIINRTNLPAQKVSICLTTLQIANCIVAHPGNQYSLVANVKK